MPATIVKKQLFGNVPQDRFKLLPHNQPDAKRIANTFLRFQNKDVSSATGIPLQSVRFDERMPEELRERAFEWAIAINLVGEFFGNESQTILWFQTPNSTLVVVGAGLALVLAVLSDLALHAIARSLTPWQRRR